MPRQPRERAQLIEDIAMDMTPMIDMVFLLLIFFMFTATFNQITLDKAVELPEAMSALPDDRPPGSVMLNIHKDDDGIFVDGAKYSQENLVNLLKSRAAANPEQLVIIRGDGRAYHRNLLDALKACAAAGLVDVRIAVTKPDFEFKEAK